MTSKTSKSKKSWNFSVWLNDPKTKEKSVSLTILVYSFILLIVVGVFQVLNKVATTGPFSELFYSSVALYFGRRLNFGGKVFTSETASETVQTVEQVIKKD